MGENILKLQVEHKISGPLAHPPTLRALQDLVEKSKTLEQVSYGVDSINGLTWYKGSAHVAIHTKTSDGHFSPTRLAVIVQDYGN
jgi:hypothetical protein